MVQVNITTTKEGQNNTDYSVRFVGTAEHEKNLTEIVHIPTVKTKKQVYEVAGERSFLYNMYLNYLEEDPNFDCQVSVDVLPTPQNATATTIEVAFDGTATTDITLDFGFFDTKHNLNISLPSGTTATQLAEALITEAKKWDDLPFDVTEYVSDAKKIVFTSRVYGSAGAVTPVKAIVNGTGLTAEITITAGTNSASADDLIDYINSKEIKSRLYVFEDGIKTDNFVEELKDWQDLKDSDKRGRMFQVKIDTMENLIADALALNESSQTILGLKKVTKDGYKCGHIFEQPCCFAAVIAGVLNMLYTKGTDCSKISTIMATGDPSNVSRPLAGIVLDQYTIIEGEEWLKNKEGNEIELLQDSGVSAFSVNRIGNLVIQDMVTTYTTDKEGNLDHNFHWMCFDECVSSFYSYIFNRQKKTMAHKRLEAGITKADFISDCQSAYKVCSGKENDFDSNRSYLFVDPEGINDFLDVIRNSYVQDFAEGEIRATLIKTAIYSQLRKIALNFKPGYIN